MKNLFLLLLLILLTAVGYLSNIDDSYLFVDSSNVDSISTNEYVLKRNGSWKYGEKELKKGFINTFLNVLTSIEIVSEAKYLGKVSGIMNISYENIMFKLELGDKLFSDNGLYLKINNNWFIVKNTFSKEIVYKDNNDLASKQYDIIYNLFNFSKEIILENTVNKP